MAVPKRVLCMMDLAVAGRSSMAVVLPVLAACGIQGCPLPTGLYSTHTGGFGMVEKRDNAEFAKAALAHYQREKLDFDGVYTGYLATAGQISAAVAAMEQYPASFKVVDPAMGDQGRLYSGLDQAICQQMEHLCRYADLITPNQTEAALLSGDGLGEAQPDKQNDWAKRLGSKQRSVLVTSVQTKQGVGIAGYDSGQGQEFWIPVEQQPQHYPGTGDLFTAAVMGLLLAGRTLRDAASIAAEFVLAAIRRTVCEQGEARQGVWFEDCLWMLREGADR